MGKELPLLACDAVAINLRSGRQTQHRMPMRPQPSPSAFWTAPPDCWVWRPKPKVMGLVFCSNAEFRQGALKYAPWQPGDSLYVRECWALAPGVHAPHDWRDVVFRADGHQIGDLRWRPSIHMPKEAARTWLKVKRPWIEQVQDISEKDARAAGATRYVIGHGPIDRAELLAEPGYWSPDLYRNGFAHMWEHLYPGSWERNDWLWCCELELDRERSGVTT